ncbi:DUF1648 domain-containing protein [Eubacterium aggregans]
MSTSQGQGIHFGRQLRISYTLLTILVWQAVIIIAIMWPTIPETIPTQFALSGAITGYGSKTTLILLCGISIAIYAMHLILINIIPKKSGPRHFFAYRLSASAKTDDITRGREIIIGLVTCVDGAITILLDVVILCSAFSLHTGPILPITGLLILASILVYEHRMKSVRAQLEERIAHKGQPLKS